MFEVTSSVIQSIYPVIEDRAKRNSPASLVEDYTQETLLKVWAAISRGKTFTNEDHFRAYCYLTLRGVQSDAYEKEHGTARRGHLVPVEDNDLVYLAASAASAESEYLSDPDLYVEEESLSLAIEGYSYDEIAFITGQKRETVNHLIRTERQRLRRHGIGVA